MALLRLLPLDVSGIAIEVNTRFTLMPAAVADEFFVKRIDDKARNGYEVYGVKGSPTATALVLLAKVPPGRHVEVHG